MNPGDANLGATYVSAILLISMEVELIPEDKDDSDLTHALATYSPHMGGFSSLPQTHEPDATATYQGTFRNLTTHTIEYSYTCKKNLHVTLE